MQTNLDFSNPKQLRELMNNRQGIHKGVNQEGEEQIMEVGSESIKLSTFQKNHWIRVNIYGSNGYLEGETFDGRW